MYSPTARSSAALLRRRQAVPGSAGQHAGRLHAHRADGVVEERSQHLQAQRRIDALQRARRRLPDQPVAVLQARLDDLAGARARRRRPGAGARSPGRWRAGRRRGPPPAADPPRRARRSRPPRTPRRSADIRAAPARTRPPPAWPPTRPAARRGSGARVRHAELHREIRPRDAEAVIVARVDDHVRRRRHVAADAVGAARARRVEVMLRRLVLLGGVAAETDLAPRRPQLAAVRIVTIGARHALVEHLRSAGTSRTRTPRRASARRGNRGGRRAARPGGCRRAAGRARRSSAN